MSRLQPLQLITRELHDVLTEEVQPGTREAVIEKTTLLLDKREQLIPEVLPPFTSAEQEIGRELVRLDEEIRLHMGKLFGAVKADMMTVKKQKKSNASYANPYQQTANADGMFLDHKK